MDPYIIHAMCDELFICIINEKNEKEQWPNWEGGILKGNHDSHRGLAPKHWQCDKLGS